MQPIKLSIEGDYWDSQIYRGRLYLWDMENVLRVYDWDAIIAAISSDPGVRSTLDLAFSRSNYLYGYDFKPLFAQPGVKQSILGPFEALSRVDLGVTRAQLLPFMVLGIDNPFNQLPDDTEIYEKSLYGLTRAGLLELAVRPTSKKVFTSIVPLKLWDGQAIAISAKRRRLAIAALSDGLFEYGFDYAEPENLSHRHVDAVNWMYSSIYCTSRDDGFMAAYHWETLQPSDEGFELTRSDADRPQLRREYDGIIGGEEIFGATGMSWGLDDKVYRVTQDGGLDVVAFHQSKLKDNPTEAFNPLTTLENLIDHREIISAGSTYFGILVEFDRSLIVLGSDSQNVHLYGPVTRWRVFPRSISYENHLHVIRDSCIDVLAFFHDWFLDQDEKPAGIHHEYGRKYRF